MVFFPISLPTTPTYFSQKINLVHKFAKKTQEKIQIFLKKNENLLFWASTWLAVAAEPITVSGGILFGVFMGSCNAFGLQNRKVTHYIWGSAHLVVKSLIFICACVFHYHIQYFCGGAWAGAQFYRIYTDRMKTHYVGLDALTHNFDLAAYELHTLVSPLLGITPSIYSKPPSRSSFELFKARLHDFLYGK